MKKQNQKGITLIALIITIIVMLILVGVTINVTLNGGLFEKAEIASSATEKDAIYEQIVSNMEITKDGKIAVKATFDKVVSDLGADKVTNINPATVDETTTEVAFRVIGKTGTYNYKISTTEIEKDPVQNQTGGLVYGKIYRATIEEDGDTFSFDISFSKKYRRVIIDQSYWEPRMYSYDEENNTISTFDTNMELSKDGKTISGTIDEMELEFKLTDEEIADKYNPGLDTGVGIYMGLYYNADVDKFICVENGLTFRAEENDYHGYDLNNSGIEIIDEKTIKYNDKEYTLLEKFE